MPFDPNLFKKIQTEYRKKFLKLQKQIEKEYTDINDSLIQKIQRLVFDYSGSDGTFPESVKKDLKTEVSAISYWFTNEMSDWVDGNIINSIDIAVDGQDTAAQYFIRSLIEENKGTAKTVLRKALTGGESGILLRARYGTGLTETLRKAVWNYRWDDGLNLSDRIWKLHGTMDKNLQTIIEQSVNQGKSAVEFSRAVEDYLEKPGPAWRTDIKPGLQAGDTITTRTGISYTVKKPRATLKYNALRLARTETNQGYHRAQKLSDKNSEVVKGTKWNLSGSHPSYPPSYAYKGYQEICDYRAKDNHHDMGPGVYPAGETPFDHPNGFCFLTSVLYEGEELINKLKEKYNNDNINIKSPQYNPVYKELNPDLSDEALVGLENKHNEVLKKGRRTGKENLVTIYKKNGQQAFESLDGSKSQVAFSQDLIDNLNNADNNSIILIHNHPSSSSFSDDDLNVLNKFSSIDTITVEGHDGTKYSCKIGKGKVVNRTEITKLYNDYKYEHMDEFRDKVIKGEIDSDQAWKEHSHRTINDMAEELGWDYKRILPEEGE